METDTSRISKTTVFMQVRQEFSPKQLDRFQSSGNFLNYSKGFLNILECLGFFEYLYRYEKINTRGNIYE